MKHRSAPLDDLFQELKLTLEEDGRPIARAAAFVVTAGYRIGCRWRKGAP